MKKYIAICLFLSFTLIASAQTLVKGKVLDKISREPLELAFVKSVNTQTSTLTNKAGYFSLPITGDSASENAFINAQGYTVTDVAINYTRKKYEIGLSVENLFDVKWNETQFNTESRLKNEPAAVEEIHFTPGVPFLGRLKVAVFF